MTSRPEAERDCLIASREPSGALVRVAVIDPEGTEPEPGQHYLLDGEVRPAAAVLSGRDGRRIEFLLSKDHLDEAADSVRLEGPFGDPFRLPSQVHPGAAGAILMGEGEGVAALALWRHELVRRGIPSRTILGFRGLADLGGLGLFDCSEIRIATRDGHRGHHGPVTDLLEALLAGDDASSAVVYAAGPEPILTLAAEMCDGRGVAFETR